MALPKLIAPEFQIKLFSIPEPVKYRPYLVGEEKIFLMAQQSGAPEDIEQAVRQIVRNCTFDRVDVAKLPTFDLEYLFLQLRARSVNNIVQLRYGCQKKDESGKACNGIANIDVDLNEVKLIVPEDHTPLVWLTEDLGVQLRYPTASLLTQVEGKTDAEQFEILLSNLLESVVMKDGTLHEAKESTPEEIKAFVESMSIQQVERLRHFFDTLPHMEHTIHFECPICHYKEDIILSGLLDFFD